MMVLKDVRQHTHEVVEVAIDELRPDPANPRRIAPTQLEALTRAIKEYGFLQPVIARLEDKTVIGGHQRLTAARKLGLTTVPVVFVDLSVEQARLLNLSLNKIGGEFDQELLGRLLADLDAVPDIDLSLAGFNDEELKKLLKNLEARDKKDRVEDFDFDEALKRAQSEPRAKQGEIWHLGEHRLMCGDSTNDEDVTRLFGEDHAVLMASDPPYLVDYTATNHPESNSSRGRKSKDKNWDEYKDPETSVEFFRKYLTIGISHLKPKSAIYQWHADKRRMLVEQAWRESGLFLHQAIVWVKSRAVLTHSHFLWQSEPCLYGWVEGQQPSKKPPSNASNVWQLNQQGESMGIHPTQKPLEVFLRPIEWHTEIGDIVYEPFSGSGTQIIAAEKLSRRCFAMEQEPRYVDVAVMRWEAFTGEKAVKVG